MRDAGGIRGGDLLLPGFVALCLMLGGSSYGGYLPNALVQLAGVALLAWLGADRHRRRRADMGRWLGLLLIASLGWAAATLVPVPATWWVWGAGRGAIAHDYAVLGMAVPARPLSLDPDRTVAAMLSLIPFLAALALTLGASARGRAGAAGVVMVVALLSVPLGAFQMLGGWQPYVPTNPGAAVGLFANTNHLATLLMMALPFAAALAVRAAPAGRGWLFVAIAAALLLGIALDGSVAGWLLAGPATAGSALVYRHGTGRPPRRRLVLGIAAMLVAAAVAATLGPLPRLLAGQTDAAARATSMRLTARAARDFLPLGAGLGSFRHLYPRYEDARAVTIEFNVHAHDDYLEVALEAGAVGIVLIAAALAWVGVRSAAAWRGGAAACPLPRAAGVALAMLLAHSLVDFPARTAAIAAVAGFAVALIEAPAPRR